MPRSASKERRRAGSNRGPCDGGAEATWTLSIVVPIRCVDAKTRRLWATVSRHPAVRELIFVRPADDPGAPAPSPISDLDGVGEVRATDGSVRIGVEEEIGADERVRLVTAPAWPAHPEWLAKFLQVLGTRIEP